VEILVDLLFDVLPGLVVRIVSNRESPRKREVLAALKRELRGIAIADEVQGTCDGAAIRVAYTRRNDLRWTEIEVDVPPSYPFTLHVCRRSGSNDPIAPVRCGDVRFDREFTIDGAPGDVASRFFDTALRRMLERPRFAVLSTHRDGERAFVRLSIDRYILDVDEVRSFIEAMARIPVRLRAAYAEADRAIAVAHEGGPYRHESSARPERDARAARVYEVERVIAMRARRE
jgi:hypothetical protein